eukprot:GILJ01006548.1.p1 GENE.GILJ01006548.1~~GILJ01006548.1.p1  ORF type:complete len:226 (-),score=15.34 GILJ01006548.1:159-836(-)
MSIVVRPYQDGDKKQVCAVFQEAWTGLAWDARKQGVRYALIRGAPLLFCAFAIVHAICGDLRCLAWVMGGLSLLFSCAVVFIAYRFGRGYTNYFQEALRTDLADVPAHYPADKHHGFFVAVKDDGSIVGMVALVSNSSEEAELKRMAVRRDCRGLGVGQKLVEYFEQQVRRGKWTYMMLATSSLHFAAQRLYTRCGFTFTHSVPLEFNLRVFFYRKELRSTPGVE